jgi:hypothetical protein
MVLVSSAWPVPAGRSRGSKFKNFSKIEDRLIKHGCGKSGACFRAAFFLPRCLIHSFEDTVCREPLGDESIGSKAVPHSGETKLEMRLKKKKRFLNAA